MVTIAGSSAPLSAAHNADLLLVSVGLPVYNAERHLTKALDSLLRQDYPNLELIVSDNASEDGTEAICRSYAERDARVHYHRADHNMGAIWNFNRVFELATGEYFMWAAHDDLRDPSYLTACVAAMQAHPDAVLCCTGILFLDEADLAIEVPPHVEGLRPTGKTPRDR